MVIKASMASGMMVARTSGTLSREIEHSSHQLVRRMILRTEQPICADKNDFCKRLRSKRHFLIEVVFNLMVRKHLGGRCLSDNLEISRISMKCFRARIRKETIRSHLKHLRPPRHHKPLNHIACPQL